MSWKKSLLAFGLAAAASQAAISYSPVTEGATESAQKLYNFIATNFGAKTISGMMTGDISTSTVKELYDVDSMYQVTGKYPALVGFDFLFATGLNSDTQWYKDYTSNAIAAATDLWNQGGIPAFTWHWKDPSDQVDAFYCTQASAGAGKDYTTYDFTQAMNADGTWNASSTTYQQIISDIDEIAAYFLQLQDAGVAAIFRPMHEASGKWFWWGLQGGANYAKLYNLIYDEMVTVKGVKNLVWVWNPEYATDSDWNPGATKYDVISLDIYEAWDYTTKFVTGYQDLTKTFGSDKVYAITENGPIPDASAMHDNNTVFAWWMPWYQSWSGKFLDQTNDNVWKANMGDACTYTLESMPGWASYQISNAPAAACTPSYKLADLDVSEELEINYPADTATNGWLMAIIDAAAGDTAKGNIIIKESTALDLSKATAITLDVENQNKSGIWFTVAFLGNATTKWGWAQPDGCWVNAGETTSCTFDLTTTTKDQVVLEGDDYTTFMSNISKVYIEIFATSWSGGLFIDNVKADDGTVINDFDTKQTIKAEQTQNITSYGIVGNGVTSYTVSNVAIKPTAAVAATKLTVLNNSVMFTAVSAGDVSVEVFGMTGKRVATLYKGVLAAGTHAFDLSDLSKGQYIIRVKGAAMNASQVVKMK